MRYFVFFTLCTALLYAATAEDIYHIYKTKGIGAVEDFLKKEFEPKELVKTKETKHTEVKEVKAKRPKVVKVKNPSEKELQSRDFWVKQLKNVEVSFGYFEGVDSVIVCEKDRKRCDIYRNDEAGLDFLRAHDVIMGKGGDKIKRGDLKTPVGVYEITKRFKPTDPFYGPLAFSLSYPNLFDALRGKSGDGIWIHGKPLDGKDRDDLSKGCVVMDNDEILSLDTEINAKSAVTIIGETKVPRMSKETVATIMSEVYRWRNAWKVNDINGYLSFYSDEFKKSDGSGKVAFSNTKKQIFARKEQKTIEFENVSVAPYPMMDDRKVFRVSFNQNYKSPSFASKGEKELYLELKGNRISILAEK